jgi:hypothetical protein
MAKETSMSFIENGTIRVGVDLSIGGAVTHVSHVERSGNLINSHDWGRQIQMSFYSGPHNYQREGKRKAKHWGGFPWNPIQSGDSFGNGSRVLESRNTGTALYVRSVPMLWPMDNDPGQCTFETWIELEGSTFRFRGRLNNRRGDTTQYRPFHQEVPAVYTNGVWHRLMTYVGERPFTDGPLTEVRKTAREPWPWSKWLASESWAALVDETGWGIGVWHPGVYEYHGGFAGRRGSGGPKDGPTGYVSPMHTDVLDHDIVYEYSCVFVVGSLTGIRQYAREHNAQRPASLTWAFEADRQHWGIRNAVDGGWPIAGGIDVALDGRRATLDSPFVFWQADQTPTLRIRASFKTKGREARVFWRPYSAEIHTTASWNAWAASWWTEERSVAMPVTNDGTMTDYVVNLGQSGAYRGALCGLRIGFPEAVKEDSVRVERISLERVGQ